MAGTCSMLCLVIITLFIPPLGVFIISGCGVDFWINVLLTILGYFPGHIHAFYLEYVYYDRRQRDPLTRANQRPAPGVYSERIQNGGNASQQNYAPQPGYASQPEYAPQPQYAPQPGYAPQQNYAPEQHYASQPNYAPQQNYGTV